MLRELATRWRPSLFSRRFRPRWAPGGFRTRLTVEELERRLAPATLLVGTAADTGLFSIRAQLAVAQPGDTLQFTSTLNGATIRLLNGTLNVSQFDIDIDASNLSQGVTLDGLGQFQVLNFSNPLVGNTLRHLTIQNGVTSGNGGGIASTGFLDLQDCTIRNNQATHGGGLYLSNGASALLRSCTV